MHQRQFEREILDHESKCDDKMRSASARRQGRFSATPTNKADLRKSSLQLSASKSGLVGDGSAHC